MNEKVKEWGEGFLYLFAFIFQIMLVLGVVVALAPKLHIIQIILLMVAGVCNWIVWLKFLDVVEMHKKIKREYLPIKRVK